MPEFSEHQTTQLDTIITNETQRFLDSLRKEDFSIAWFFGNLTINPLKKRIRDSLTSKSIKNDITNFVGLNFLGKLIVTPELIDRVNTFKKEIISMRMRYDVEHIIPTNEELNQLRETIGVTKRTAEDSQRLQQKVNNGQQNPPRGNPRPPQRQEQRQEQRQQRESVQEGNEYISKEHVEKVWQDILNGATYQSDTKGKCTRWINEYKGVCTTWAYNVLSRLINLPPPENTDYNGYEEKLKAMHCYFYRDDVNPKNPYAWWYKPKDWDMAVRPRFESKHGRTQHMACYIHGERVSDTIQRIMGPDRKPTNIPTMSCYLSDPSEPQKVQIYRYDPKRNS